MRKAVGAALSELRLKRKISQGELAEMSSIDRSYMCGMEHGRYNPSFHTMYKVCKPLRITFKKLAATVERHLHRHIASKH
jgi:transcriptional regulator with XRE-family HTH domain